MVDFKEVAQFQRFSGARQAEVVADRYRMAHVMRENLASDIVNGRYGSHSVIRQILAIEDYEETTYAMHMAMEVRE